MSPQIMETNTTLNGAASNPNQALWEKGDFTEIAAFMRQSGEALVESLGVRPPLRALDLGCGDGTTAMPLALLGADVTGVDIASNLVSAGNKRVRSPKYKAWSTAAGWTIKAQWQGKIDGPFSVTIRLPPGVDLDNGCKAIIDLVGPGKHGLGVTEDDRQMVELHVYRSRGALCQVTIEART